MKHLSSTLAVAALLLAQAALAQDGRVEDERFVSDRILLSFDGLLATVSSSARVDASTGDGTNVDIEGDLGASSDTDVFAFSGHFKIGRRHRVFGRYEAFDRNAARTLERDLHVGDHVFLAGSQARARAEFSLPQLSYRYDFVKREPIEFGFTAGIVLAGLDFDIEGETASPGGGASVAENSVSVSAPVPQLGFAFDWFAGDHLIVRGGVQYFQAAIGSFDGSWTDVTARLEWHPWKHVGFGAGYRYTRIGTNFDDEDGGRSGEIKYSESGLTGGLSFTW